MAGKKRKIWAWLVLPILAVLLFGKIELAYSEPSDLLILPNPKIGEYLKGLEYIVMIPDPYPPSYMTEFYKTKFDEVSKDNEDYEYMMNPLVVTALLYPNGKDGDNSIGIELKKRILKRLENNNFKKIPVLIVGQDKDLILEEKVRKMVRNEADRRKIICLQFRLGQQKMRLGGKEIMLGAIATTVNACDSFLSPDFNLFGNINAPEPFIYDPETGDRASFERAMDFVAYRLTNYLNNLGRDYPQP